MRNRFVPYCALSYQPLQRDNSLHGLILPFTTQPAYAPLMAQPQENPVLLDWTDCPLVEINPRKLSGTPVLRGSRMPADAIVENYKDGLPAGEIAEVFELHACSVRELLAYAVARNPTLKP